MSDRKRIASKIFHQLNETLLEKMKQSEIMDHNLEKGLGNEQIFRDLLSDFLPDRYGVAKGKIVNSQGEMSKQCDVIIYDRMNCPKLFIDNNQNQILPIEGIYCVIEIKTTINRTILDSAFKNLLSTHQLINRRMDMSTNDHLYICPPEFIIFAYNDNRPVEKLVRDFRQLNQKYHVKESFSSYSKISAGYDECTGDTHLVSEIVVLNKWEVYHMFNSSVAIGDWKEGTLGVFLTGLLSHLNEVRLPDVNLVTYYNWLTINKKSRTVLDPE